MSANISEDFLLNKRIEIGARLTAIRVKRGLTVDQVADITGLSRANIRRIEAGKYNFEVNTLVLFSIALEFDIELVLK
jgi:transcriptional regulator with XRE-family HTH domain